MKTIKGGITAVPGFLASGIYCGIKKIKGPDLALIVSSDPCTAAGLFTTNRVTAAPVRLTQNHIKSGRMQAIIANSGNANACTGPRGERAAREMAELTARQLGIATEMVAVASTGVIGKPLSLRAIRNGIPSSVKILRRDGGRNAARAIMTTDKFIKEAAVRLKIGGRTVTVGGIAKGSGMIHPNMATMLAFLATDVRVKPALLRAMLTSAVNRSFNMITVDGETSTNDMVLCLANGRAGNPGFRESKINRAKFQAAMDAVCLKLARMVVEDGEGATKQTEIRVRGAANFRQAKTIALRVANSNLVKTSFFGADANWGRIMAAIGAAGVKLNPYRIDLSFDHVPLVKNGVGLGKAADRRATRVLKQQSFSLTIDLHGGTASATAWTCDLTYDYIRINAAYRS
ncbi:MAG: bifunctional glutamate N-acetyltransferase/amino-acid acetyltransferase ArgJ [Nitrospirae bacterium]|nr:bifunctional glutamate N-acetyltransferase/amino-acid acetyltransferase ArgJ [Nitrospirota bacterium]